uniref:Uncharacterized protein n=2 Tax=Ditylum brightwellii TaxID=49249 RepID=A0A7S4VV80_9STRA
MSAQQSVPTKNTKRNSAARNTDGGDGIHQIDESRSFFVTLSSKSCVINWLMYDEQCFETMPNQTEHVPSHPPVYNNSLQSEHPPSEHVAYGQQQNNVPQLKSEHPPSEHVAYGQQQNNIPQQYTSNYHQPQHWQHQPYPVNQEIPTRFQHIGWYPSFHVGQGGYDHHAFRGERTHQAQQRERNPHHW